LVWDLVKVGNNGFRTSWQHQGVSIFKMVLRELSSVVREFTINDVKTE